jgi:hypothetical protein
VHVRRSEGPQASHAKEAALRGQNTSTTERFPYPDGASGLFAVDVTPAIRPCAARTGTLPPGLHRVLPGPRCGAWRERTAPAMRKGAAGERHVLVETIVALGPGRE